MTDLGILNTLGLGAGFRSGLSGGMSGAELTLDRGIKKPRSCDTYFRRSEKR